MREVSLPHGYHSVNQYLNTDDAEGLIAFLVAAFGATEQGPRDLAEGGRIEHAEVRIGDSIVMISQADAGMPARPAVSFVYVDDVDATHRAALAAGAVPILEPADQPWGDRVAGFHDPWDNRWWVATRS